MTALTAFREPHHYARHSTARLATDSGIFVCSLAHLDTESQFCTVQLCWASKNMTEELGISQAIELCSLFRAARSPVSCSHVKW